MAPAEESDRETRDDRPDRIADGPDWISPDREAEPPPEDWEDEFDWLVHAELFAVGYIHILTGALERGDAELGVDPSAWENTMAAVEWAMMEHVEGRVQGPTTITVEDVARMRKLHALGSAALSGGERSPELRTLSLQCMESLLGPGWRRMARESERDVRALNQPLLLRSDRSGAPR